MPNIIAWSWSRLETFEQCPKRMHGKDVAKIFPKPSFEAPHFKKGKAVHKALEDYLAKGTPLPYPVPEINGPEKFFVRLDYLQNLLDKMRKGQLVNVEKQICYDIRMKEVSWFSKEAWCRVIIDAMVLHGDYALLIDWKTGKVKKGTDQLKLFAGAVMKKFPYINRVTTAYVWCEHKDAKPAIQHYTRNDLEDIWQDFGDRQELIQLANESGNWPAKPNAFCKWCEARADQCEHKPE